MNKNVVYPSEDPPAYSELPSAAPASSSYGQSTLLHDDGGVHVQQGGLQQGPPPQAVNQYPPAGHANDPAQTGPGPYPPPGYG